MATTMGNFKTSYQFFTCIIMILCKYLRQGFFFTCLFKQLTLLLIVSAIIILSRRISRSYTIWLPLIVVTVHVL